MISAPAPNVQVYSVPNPAPNQAYVPNPGYVNPAVQMSDAPPSYSAAVKTTPLQAGNPRQAQSRPFQSRPMAGQGAFMAGYNMAQDLNVSHDQEFGMSQEVDTSLSNEADMGAMDFSGEAAEPSAPSYEEY